MSDGVPPPGGGAPFQQHKGDGLDPMLLASVGILLTALLLIIVRLLKLQWDEKAAKQRTAALLAMAEQEDQDRRREAQMAGGRRRGQVRRRVNHDDDDGFVNNMLNAQMGVDEEQDDGDVMMDGPNFDEGMGKKKTAKMAMKEEKKAMRQQELAEREERKKREQKEEEEREKEREKERQDEEAEEERKRKEKAEREQRELEEYMKLKEAFAVEEEGFDEIEGEEKENLMKDFVDYVTKNKVVNMDELGAHFGLKTEEAVNRLQHFLDNEELTGVMDDRGKFIYITEDELAGVAKFINQRGRVSIVELAEYSNNLISLEAAEE